MNNLKEALDRFHQPTLVGSVTVSGKTQCMGWCQDASGTLIALSVIGGTTSIEAIWANISKGKPLTILINDENYRSQYASTRDCKFRFFKTPIPDSSYRSMIALNEGLFCIPKGAPTAYLPFIGDWDDLHFRLFRRVKEIVHLPVQEAWGRYLYEEGSNPNRRMCGPLLDNGSVTSSFARNNVVAKGFQAAWFSTFRERWEKIITDGLRGERIGLSGADPIAEREVV
jgi:hypothetical protein